MSASRATILATPCHKNDGGQSYVGPQRRLRPIEPADLSGQKPDTHWTVTDERSTILGRCSLWWRNTPAHGEHRIGLIGHYAVRDSSAARRVLQRACDELAANGCTMAVGPMDGNTWRQYRLVTESGSEPPFFLEPNNPVDWPEHFRESGFSPLSYYFSSLNEDLKYCDSRVEEIAGGLKSRGVRVRSIDVGRVEDDLRKIHRIAAVAFRNNLLYSEVEQEEFVAQYTAFRHVVAPELVLIAEHFGRPVAFVFALPDLLERVSGRATETVIIKTLGALPGRRYAGLGQVLLARVQAAACRLGYTRAIHALVRETPHLCRISARYARPIRRYALFAKVLCT